MCSSCPQPLKVVLKVDLSCVGCHVEAKQEKIESTFVFLGTDNYISAQVCAAGLKHVTKLTPVLSKNSPNKPEPVRHTLPAPLTQ